LPNQIKIEEIARVLETCCSHLAEKAATIKAESSISETTKSSSKPEKKEQDENDEKIAKDISKLKEELAKAEKEYDLTPEFEKELLETFLTSSKSSLNNIIAALSTGDLKQYGKKHIASKVPHVHLVLKK